MSNPFDPFDPFGPYGPGDPMMVDPFLDNEPFAGAHCGYSDLFAPSDIFAPNSWQEPYRELYPDPVGQLYEPVYVDFQPPEHVDIYAPLPDEIALEQPGSGWSMGQEEIFEIWEEWVDLQAELETGTTSLDILEMEIENSGESEDEESPSVEGESETGAPASAPAQPIQLIELEEEKPVAFTPEQGPEVETRSRSTYYREPRPREWRPRPPKGIRGSSRRRRSKRTKKSEEEVRLCPMTCEIVSLNECKTCEFYKEGECTWEPEEGQEEGETQGDAE